MSAAVAGRAVHPSGAAGADPVGDERAAGQVEPERVPELAVVQRDAADELEHVAGGPAPRVHRLELRPHQAPAPVRASVAMSSGWPAPTSSPS